MKQLIIAALVLAAAPLFAQDKITTASSSLTRQTLMHDPDVLWLGVAYSVFLLDELNTKKTENSYYLDSMGIKNNHHIHVAPIKNIDLRKKPIWYPEELDLIHTLVDSETVKKGLFYTESDCATKFSYEDFVLATTSKDSIITFDPDTFQERVQVLIYQLNIHDITHYWATHLVYYNQRTNTWGTLMEAVAPMRNLYDSDGNYMSNISLFWIKIDNKKTIQNLNNPDISWARRTTRTFSWDRIATLKTTKTVAECMDLMIEKIHKNAEKEVVCDANLKKLTTEEKLALCPATDSISFTDFVNFEVSTQTKENFSGKYVEQFRLMQEWYWDNKKSKMLLNTAFFVPIINRYDNRGNFLFRETLFWKPIKME